MEELVLDAETLFNIADIIDGYCAKQREVVNVYHAQIMALESEWRDDETFGTMVEELNALKMQALVILDEVYETYPKYFRKRAQKILERPIYRGKGTTVYVPTAPVGGSTGTTGYRRWYGANVGYSSTAGVSSGGKSATSRSAKSVGNQDISFGLTGEGESTGSVDSKGGFLNWVCSVLGKKDTLEKALKGVEHRPIKVALTQRTEEQIVNDISGGDLTEGSCSSLAFAYAGNKEGYVVYDFRDGQSRRVFSSRDTIKQIATMEGVESKIEIGTNDGICAERLMSQMKPGKEYYMATGRHAAVVREKIEGGYQYLELQSGIPSENGWQPLTQRALYERFGCQDGHSTEWSNYLISLDSLQSNTEFLNLLGYINTDKSAQAKGVKGYVR
ncbi:MAG: hypothetical protein K2L07_13355 [Lachnospiraceae bacterium]|nr:hypothetical protein [Lachnospiraceae bacterium]